MGILEMGILEMGILGRKMDFLFLGKQLRYHVTSLLLRYHSRGICCLPITKIINKSVLPKVLPILTTALQPQSFQAIGG